MQDNFAEFQEYFFSLTPLKQAGFFLWPSLSGQQLSQLEIDLLREIEPSGLVFFKRNFSSMEQATVLISQLQQLLVHSERKFTKRLVTAIDEEGGRVSRLPLPDIRGMSAWQYASQNDKAALTMHTLAQCQAAKQIGINCLLAPVADILTEKRNSVIGDRSFGTSAQQVSEYAGLVHNILTQEKLFSCAKHFPGHGNTLQDSHTDISISHATLDTLRKREWLPFIHLINNGIAFIMTAHVLLPNIDPYNPASLSYKLLSEYLRNELNFSGLILSDDLRMNAIALHYNVKKKTEASVLEAEISFANTNSDAYLKIAAIDALTAGCDILLSCQSIEREYIIAQSIASQIQLNKNFKLQMLAKAWRIYSICKFI